MIPVRGGDRWVAAPTPKLMSRYASGQGLINYGIAVSWRPLTLLVGYRNSHSISLRMGRLGSTKCGKEEYGAYEDVKFGIPHNFRVARRWALFGS